MESRRNTVKPHPNLIETLFAYKSRVSAIFNDVLGIHHLNHFSIARVDKEQTILVFSSTPSIEFNLFTTSLWRFDNTFNPGWFTQCNHALSSSLYNPKRYNELYFTRQQKPELPTAYTIAVENDGHYIYSIASGNTFPNPDKWFTNHEDDFYKMGKYCTNLLTPLFHQVTNSNHL
ncbi:MAG: hypothetical protein Q8M03_07550 [Legionella sp.]|nr:hypothetical protein [Legionella sp.]